MRCYTFQAKGLPGEGIAVGGPSSGQFCNAPVILVGQEGRGRWCSPVVLDVNELDATQKVLKEAGAAWSRASGVRLVAHTPSDRALVLVPSLMGYRGVANTYALSLAPRYVPAEDTSSNFGDPQEKNESPGRKAWVAGRTVAKLPVIDGVAASGAHKARATPPSVGGLLILAGGVAADGDAGRMGSCGCYLLLVEPGEGILVVRTGRLYGNPATNACRWTGTAWVPVDHTGEAPTSAEIRL